MFKKIADLFGLKASSPASPASAHVEPTLPVSPATPTPGASGAAVAPGAPVTSVLPPSTQAATIPANIASMQRIYDLLFCDQLALWAPSDERAPTPWQRVLFAPTPDAQAVRALAEDETQESRVRVLAFNWLRAHQLPVPSKLLLGVVLEVPQRQGMDVLGAYADGQVRYINQSGKLAVVDDAASVVARQARTVIVSAQQVVDRIGPWEEPRLPPPQSGATRMTFLVSDGLYLGEATFATLQRDPMAGPILENAAHLLKMVVDTALD